ncbi:MAG: chemotaxis protein CheW [Helicobacteraceae bacterium]|nr:chemotaxis protein CheW [Helicobacteraceae bacterium]
MQIKEILVIEHDDISYAIDTNKIDQILRVPNLTVLPLSPREVRGLCAVAGDITPALDLNILLDIGQVDVENEDSRLLLLNDDDKKMAMLVSSITITLSVDEESLESVDSSDESAICAIYHNNNNNKIIQVLDIKTLSSGVKLKKYDPIEIKDGTKSGIVVEKISNKERYLVFKMANEQFAVHIDDLREIITVPTDYSDIAGSSAEILGLVSLREELMIIADLRMYYNLEATSSDKNRVLIVYVNDKKIGLIVDQILDIAEYEQSELERMPINFQDTKISGVIHSGEQLISIISSQALIPLIAENDKFSNSSETEVALQVRGELEVVVFKLDSVEYAFDIEYVAEIMDVIDSTNVALSDSRVDGIINIRGQIVTLVSLHRRLGVQEVKSVQEKIIICNINGTQMGFRVDSVSGIYNILDSDIREAKDNAALFSNVLHLDGGNRLVLLFKINDIFN